MSNGDKNAEAGDGPSAEFLEQGAALFAKPWRFLKSVPALEFLPPGDRPEFAVAGRSNVGKSSLVNALVNQRGLARTSNTPGRTQELNFFETESIPAYLVDMPGYGYAKAPKALVDAWTLLVENYLKGRTTLRRVYLLIDSRHGIKPVDLDIMKMLNIAAVSYQIVMTKIDKISLAKRAIILAETHAKISKEAAAFPHVIATSSETGEGIPELRAAIAHVLAQ